MTDLTPLLVPARFNGPPRSGNGGWVAGALAAALPSRGLDGAVTVTLRQPPPLEEAMAVTRTATGGVELARATGVVAVAEPAALAPTPVPPVSRQEAWEAESRYLGLDEHPFPGCFVCGTGRAVGDGLRLFAGPVAGASTGAPRRVACTWQAEESSLPFTWAALDCPGGWSSDLQARPSVLGRMTTQVLRLPAVGESTVVVGEQRAIDGRKTSTAASLYSRDGDLLATAEHVWIAIDPAAFR